MFIDTNFRAFERKVLILMMIRDIMKKEENRENRLLLKQKQKLQQKLQLHREQLKVLKVSLNLPLSLKA